MKPKLNISIGFIFSIVFICYMNTIELGIIFFISVLLHEFGHYLMCILNGIKVHNITFNIIGAHVGADRNDLDSKSKNIRLLVYSGGIIFNLLLIVLSTLLYMPLLFVVNFIIILLSLLPMSGSDGNKILSEFVGSRTLSYITKASNLIFLFLILYSIYLLFLPILSK